MTNYGYTYLEVNHKQWTGNFTIMADNTVRTTAIVEGRVFTIDLAFDTSQMDHMEITDVLGVAFRRFAEGEFPLRGFRYKDKAITQYLNHIIAALRVEMSKVKHATLQRAEVGDPDNPFITPVWQLWYNGAVQKGIPFRTSEEETIALEKIREYMAKYNFAIKQG